MLRAPATINPKPRLVLASAAASLAATLAADTNQGVPEQQHSPAENSVHSTVYSAMLRTRAQARSVVGTVERDAGNDQALATEKQEPMPKLLPIAHGVTSSPSVPPMPKLLVHLVSAFINPKSIPSLTDDDDTLNFLVGQRKHETSTTPFTSLPDVPGFRDLAAEADVKEIEAAELPTLWSVAIPHWAIMTTTVVSQSLNHQHLAALGGIDGSDSSPIDVQLKLVRALLSNAVAHFTAKKTSIAELRAIDEFCEHFWQSRARSRGGNEPTVHEKTTADTQATNQEGILSFEEREVLFVYLFTHLADVLNELLTVLYSDELRRPRGDYSGAQVSLAIAKAVALKDHYERVRKALHWVEASVLEFTSNNGSADTKKIQRQEKYYCPKSSFCQEAATSIARMVCEYAADPSGPRREKLQRLVTDPAFRCETGAYNFQGSVKDASRAGVELPMRESPGVALMATITHMVERAMCDSVEAHTK